MKYMTLTEAKANFSAVVEQSMAGEEIIITKMGKPAVKISRLDEKPKKSLFGSMKGKITLHPGWEEWDEPEARALGIID